MIVGEAPGHREDEEGRAFVNDQGAGGLLDEFLKKAGIERSEVYITNAVHCRPPDNRTPKKAEVKACRYWLEQEIAHLKPKFILAMGNTALEGLGLGAGIKQKRGQLFSAYGAEVIPTYHPAYALPNRMPAAKGVIQSDVTRFAQLAGLSETDAGSDFKFTIVDNDWKFQDAAEALMNDKWFVFDTEGSGLDWWHEDYKVVSLQFTTQHHSWYIPLTHPESPWDWLRQKQMLKSIYRIVKEGGHRRIAHYGKYDCHALWRATGLPWNFDDDTGLMRYAQDENQIRGLKESAAEEFDAPNWDIPLDQKRGNAPIKHHAKYACLDPYWTRRLYKRMRIKLAKDVDAQNIYHMLLMRATKAVIQWEEWGIPLNKTKLKSGREWWKIKRNRAKQQLNRYIGSGVNIGSPQQLAVALYDRLELPVLEKTPGGARSTNESVLLRLKAEHPVPGLILEWREAEKQLNTFIDVWQGQAAQSIDGRLHPTAKLDGAITGRLSYENPGLQHVPREKLIRSIIDSDDSDWIFVEADYSQVELRFVAEVSQDPVMKLIFQTGGDIHVKTCNDLLGLLSPTPEERKKAKAINFGFIYGMWWRKFIVYARDNYGITVSEQDAKNIRKRYFRLYAGVPNWHVRVKKFAHANGYVASLIGRKRRLPILLDQPMDYEKMTPEMREAERQGINSPIQSIASDVNLDSAVEIHNMAPPTELKTLGLVHDSTLRLIHRKHFCHWMPIIKRVMENPPIFKKLGVEISVPLVVDFKIGPWGAGTEYKSMDEILAWGRKL